RHCNRVIITPFRVGCAGLRRLGSIMSTPQPAAMRQLAERGLVTERKPAGMSFTSWIDQQINEAAERGLFDDLPGAGKPLPKRDEADAAQAWLREYLRREGLSTQDVLPTPLRLRKERE